jgi:DNA (cytosine-5)-methyltransferase 1
MGADGQACRVRQVQWPGWTLDLVTVTVLDECYTQYVSSRSMRPSNPTHRSLNLRAIDLFCGAGGLTEGFTAAGFEIVFALDRDRDSCETYRVNHPETKLEHRSITDLEPKDLARWLGPIDVILGGPSCQGFSTHGRRTVWADPDDERNKLWRHMFGIVAAVRPKAFLLENVPGLAYYKDGTVRGEIVTEFAKLGYNVNAKILLAADYGVPQLRRRVFVVGLRKPLTFSFPEPTHLGGWRRDTLEQWEDKRRHLGLLRHITLWEAIGDLPSLTSPIAATEYRCAPESEYAQLIRRASDQLRDHEVTPLSEKHRALVAHVPPGGTWRDIPPHLLPDRFRGGMRRTDSTNLLGRLDPNRPAYTITTQFNNVTGGCFTHPFEERALSAREGARLQSFPDSYAFTGSLASRCRQIGNAVPPILAHHLASELATTLDSSSHPKLPRVVRSVHEPVDPLPPTDLTKKRMKAQKRKDTAAELQIRDALILPTSDYQLNVRPEPELRREVDLAFFPEKVAVFVDGCFWHGCPVHTRPTKSNTKWWADKIEANRKRDAATTIQLRRRGWAVLRIWEHEQPQSAASRIERRVAERRAERSSPAP